MAILHFPIKSIGKIIRDKIIKEILILFSNYFAINYFANVLSPSFGTKYESDFKVLLPISWEKGVKDSRVQGFECLFSNDFINALSILSTSHISSMISLSKALSM